MAKLLDYLIWRGDVALDYDGFNELDAAVLCKLSYIPFELTGGIVRRQGVPLKELTAYLSAVPEVESKLKRVGDLTLCRQVSQSRRYENVRVYAYVSRWDLQSETQFAAICFKLPVGICCVAFRGTDDTLVGWKEDLNMALMFPVPAQESAAEYLNGLESLIGDDRLILCGHSKGGNLAVYAGACCCRPLQNRIQLIYNFDGPGFDKAVLERPDFRRIKARTVTFLPRFSVVGMLLENDGPHRVVNCEASGILQHDFETWVVGNGAFDYAEDITDSSKAVARFFAVWLSEMDKDEREGFVEALYQILTQNNATTVEELAVNKVENAIMTLRTIRHLEDKTKSNAMKALRLLVSSLRNPQGS